MNEMSNTKLEMLENIKTNHKSKVKKITNDMGKSIKEGNLGNNHKLPM